MKFVNKVTGDELHNPPPDETGRSTVTLNGKPILSGIWSDKGNGSFTLDSGEVLSPQEFAQLARKLLQN